MAYSVDLITLVQSWICTNETADDGTPDAIITDCMTNAVTAVDCDELKEGTVNLKVTVGFDPSLINTLKIQIYCDEAMTVGNNTIMPYTDADSVDNTYGVETYYGSTGWKEHDLSANLIAQLGNQSESFSLRLASEDLAKTKVSEVQIDVDWDQPMVSGITRDGDPTSENFGDPLGSVECYLLKVVSSSEYEFVDHVTSHATTGAYSLGGHSTTADYVVAFYKDDTSDVMDLTEKVNAVVP